MGLLAQTGLFIDNLYLRAFTGAVEQTGLLNQKYLDERWDGEDTGWGALSVFPLFNVLCNLVGVALRETCGKMDFGYCDGLPDDGPLRDREDEPGFQK